MSIVFHCQCGQRISAPDGSSGRTGKCHNCGKTVTVPPTFPLSFNGKRLGEFTQEKIVAMLQRAEITCEAMIKDRGWKSLSLLPWAVEAAASTPAAPAAPEPPATGKRVTCPHCWHQFRMSQINYISKHPQLLGDPVLGASAPTRFLPTRFSPQGYALDAKGEVCPEMACPRCHLYLPEAVLDRPSLSFSIVGAQGSGKSYFLTAMIWQLRRLLPAKFDFNFVDTDPKMNIVLNDYESRLFLNKSPDQLVGLPKTELQGGDFSNNVVINGENIDLPLPFVFTLSPTPTNTQRREIQNVIFYDNAGEHFQVGRDSFNNPATSHMVHSQGIICLYDPLRDARMARKCNPDDPQIKNAPLDDMQNNQTVMLNEIISRIKKHTGLKTGEKLRTPLVMVVPKFDAWQDIFPYKLRTTEEVNGAPVRHDRLPVYYHPKTMQYFLDLSLVAEVSYALRERLLGITPEVVAACETFFSTVYFVPVSAMGAAPVFVPEQDMIAIRPKDIAPLWAEVPMMILFYHARLLQGVAPKEGEYAELAPGSYQFANDMLIYTLPGGTARLTAPANYWGRIVPGGDGKRYLLPKPPEADKPVPDPAGVGRDYKAGEDDFWKE